jgi:hypothetical protein
LLFAHPGLHILAKDLVLLFWLLFKHQVSPSNWVNGG